jgi:hypothetical protein
VFPISQRVKTGTQLQGEELYGKIDHLFYPVALKGTGQSYLKETVI